MERKGGRIEAEAAERGLESPLAVIKSETSVNNEGQMGGREHNVEQILLIALFRECQQAYVVARILICDPLVGSS